MAIVCLALVVLLVGSLLRLALTHRRQVQYEQSRLQADWLAEAGLERAAYRLQQDPQYAGETWKLNADRLGGGQAGQVTIRVAVPAQDPQVRQVEVQATYPLANPHFATRTKKLPVRIAAIPG